MDGTGRLLLEPSGNRLTSFYIGSIPVTAVESIFLHPVGDTGRALGFGQCQSVSAKSGETNMWHIVLVHIVVHSAVFGRKQGQAYHLHDAALLEPPRHVHNVRVL